jgi:MFS family permease
MPEEPSSGAAVLLRHRPFVFFFFARSFSRFSHQIASVAIGWQVYELTDSAFYLGMVGLVQFLPTAALVFVAGHAADIYDRKRVSQVCMLGMGITAAALAWGSVAGWLTVHWLFGAVAVFGTATAFEQPATGAMLNEVVPKGMLQRGSAMSSAVGQLANISGPALGGLAYAFTPGLPYALMGGFWLAGAVLMGSIRTQRQPSRNEPPTLAAIFAGFGFVRNNPAILGTISLDLFAVLLGGASALLPIYARDILHTGPWGVGVLRGAIAVGAFLMSVTLAHSSITRRVGMRMFQAVIIYGVATVAFGLSHWLWLSVIALVIMGAADMISVVIRVSLVQLRTPDAMRGRVGAVNYLFINASNQLGAFESGVMAALVGAMPAVVIGGVGTVAVALLWMRWFPSLKAIERLE